MSNALTIIDNLLQHVMPLALKAKDDLKDATSIMNLASCCYGSEEHLTAALREICERTQTRLQQLLNLGLISAFSALLFAHFELRSVRMCQIIVDALKETTRSNPSWKCKARACNMHIALAQVLQLVPIERPDDADSVSEQLRVLLAHQPYEVLLSTHRHNATRALVQHVNARSAPMRLLAELCRCNNACRFILRRRARATHTLNHVLTCLAAGDSLSYLPANQALCRLIDNDIVRVTNYVDVIHVVNIVMTHLLAEGDHLWHVPSLQLLRSIMGRGVTCFEGQEHCDKHPPEYEVDAVISSWCAAFGTPCLLRLLQITDTNGAWRMSVLIIGKLVENVPLTLGVAHETLKVVCARLMVVRDLNVIRKLLQIAYQVCLSAQINPNSHLSLVNSCNVVRHKYQFEHVCRGKKFYHAPIRHRDTQEACVVCMELLIDDVRVTNCKHHMHAGCLRRWLTVNKNCPLCRHDGVDAVTEIMGGSLDTINSVPRRQRRRLRRLQQSSSIQQP